MIPINMCIIKKIKNIEHNTNATTLECCREEKNHSYNKLQQTDNSCTHKQTHATEYILLCSTHD